MQPPRAAFTPKGKRFCATKTQLVTPLIFDNLSMNESASMEPKMRTVFELLLLASALFTTGVAAAAFGYVIPITLFRKVYDWIENTPNDARRVVIKSFLPGLALYLFALTFFLPEEIWGWGKGEPWAVVIFSLVICIAPTLLVMRLVIPFLDRKEHGSAELMSKKAINEWANQADQPQGLILGRTTQSPGRDLKYTGEAHLLTIAPNRSGKGVGAIIPNLLSYRGSILVVDPKGENARVTARRRGEIGKCYVLDPFGTTDHVSASYNPLARITESNPDRSDDAAALADALVVRAVGEDSHWDDEAAALLEGMILFTALYETPERRHLGTVREIITESPDRFAKILDVMKDCGGLVARTANRHLSKSDREASSVLSTAQRHTKFLDSDRMAKVLAPSDKGLSFAELKRYQGTTVFLCIPPDRLDTYGRWLRLMVNEALLDMANDDPKPTLPVLFLLDEFAALGQLQSVKRAMGLMAGYGMRLWPFLQDLSQLTSTYAEAAGTFFANAGAIQLFGMNDIETAKRISETIGQETVVMNESSHARSLMTPDELMNLSPDTQILMLQGRRPVIARKLRYFDDPAFAHQWDTDPRR
jgi:type IV secretion system protein VirD4